MSIVRNLLLCVALILLTSCSFVFIQPPSPPVTDVVPRPIDLGCSSGAPVALDFVIGFAFGILAIAATAEYAKKSSQAEDNDAQMDMRIFSSSDIRNFGLVMGGLTVLHVASGLYGYFTTKRCNALTEKYQVQEPSAPMSLPAALRMPPAPSETQPAPPATPPPPPEAQPEPIEPQPAETQPAPASGK